MDLNSFLHFARCCQMDNWTWTHFKSFQNVLAVLPDGNGLFLKIFKKMLPDGLGLIFNNLDYVSI